MDFSAKCRPKHFKYEGVTTWEHSSYDCFINALKAQSEGLKIHSEPFVELFGIPLMFNHTINDADLVRSFFNTDKERTLQTLDLELNQTRFSRPKSVIPYLYNIVLCNLSQGFMTAKPYIGTRAYGNGWFL